jgi:hypothetical protein
VLAIVEEAFAASGRPADLPEPDVRCARDAALEDLARVARADDEARTVRLLAEILDAARADGWWVALREALDVEYPEGDFPLRRPLESPDQRNVRYAVRMRFAARVWAALRSRGWPP